MNFYFIQYLLLKIVNNNAGAVGNCVIMDRDLVSLYLSKWELKTILIEINL